MNRRERRNKVKNRGTSGETIDHQKYVNLYRHHVMRVIKNVRAGIVDEEDLDKLQNFCQQSLTLWSKSTMAQLQAAWRDCEITSLMMEEYGPEIVLDPKKQEVAHA